MPFPVTIYLRSAQEANLTPTQCDTNISNLAAACNENNTSILSITSGLAIVAADLDTAELQIAANTAAITALQGPIITDATTERVIGNSDAWGYIRMTNAGASTVTVPAGLAIAAGTEITVFAAGSAGVSFVASGTTINAVGLTLDQYRAATLKYLGSDAYDLIGGLT